MNSPRMTPAFDSVSRFTHAREGSQFGLTAKALAICILLLGFSPFVISASEPVNINLASAEALAGSFLGVGLGKAHRMVQYREAHGSFEHTDELAAVQGIGSAAVEKNCSVIWL